MIMATNPLPLPKPFSAPIWAGSTDNNVPAVAGTSGYLAGAIVVYGGGIGVSGSSGSGAGVYGASDSGAGVYGTSQNWDGVHGESQSNQHAGVSGVNNSSGPNGMGVYGRSKNADGVQGWSESNAHAGVSGTNNRGGYGVWGNSPDGIAIHGQGKTAGHFQGDVTVTGTLTVGVDIVMPAADFAEDFSVKASETIEPGTIMVLDENGILRTSDKSYDRKVAGIISGAGDYRPGLILDRQKSTEGRLPLALVGKVCCKADATYGPIEVGDLLTTSPTRGHAMKASDTLKAFGSVIGKALKPLNAGQGLIPVLVSLQ
jgi:hypothetical protein